MRVRLIPTVAALAALTLGGISLRSLAAPKTSGGCSVENVSTGIIYGTLQAAVDGSSSGDSLRIAGTCVGRTVIKGRRLKLVGVSTTAQPTPTLDGGGTQGVLSIKHSSVTIRDLTITNGMKRFGSGIAQRYGVVRLRGSSAVSGNRGSRVGDGIGDVGGSLELLGSTTVSGNATDGIDVDGGSLVLSDSASVADNLDFGIVAAEASVTMRDATSVSGSVGGGRGIYVQDASTLRMKGSATVTGNSEGIEADQSAVILGGTASVSANTYRGWGAGISLSSHSSLSMKGSASVTGNSAKRGGGLFVFKSHVVLHDSAAVTGNTATDGIGGGIDKESGIIWVCSDLVAISPNTPDDPPKVRHACS